MRRLLQLNSYCEQLGLQAGMRYALTRMRWCGPRPGGKVSLHPKGLANPVWLRGQPSSDCDVLEQIFLRREYSCFDDLRDVRTIVDAGANIGLASLYFANRFPEAEIIAIEPDAGNFEVLQRNVAAYPKIKAVNGAIWGSRGKLKFSSNTFRDGREWSRQVEEDGIQGEVQGYTIPELIGHRTVDIFKIDIERAEIPLFRQGAPWLAQVRNLCIELHDEECREVFFRATQPFQFDVSASGDLTVCRDIRKKEWETALSE